ncbi:hypothetical protein OROHE_014479 [Orobanche hederae]
MFKKTEDEFEDGFFDDGEEENKGFDAEEVSEDENGRIHSGHVQFAEGIKAFKLSRRVKALSGGDIEPFLRGSSRRSNQQISGLSNIFSRSFGKVRGSNGIVDHAYSSAQGSGVPSHLRGQNFYVDLSLFDQIPFILTAMTW